MMSENNLQIGHLLEDEDRKGSPVSIQWDKEDGEDWIILKDADGKLILKVQKILWENTTAGFTPEVRDSIIKHTRRLYG